VYQLASGFGASIGLHPLTAAALLRGVIVFLPTDFHGDLNSSRGSGLPT
jgi:hypothetical protein